MELTLADQYYLKAVDFYSFDMATVIENLNCALSYDEWHAPANCLLGRIYMYDLKNYDKAGQCFYQAVIGDPRFPDTYKYYGLLRIWQGEYDRALKIIQRGLKVKGMDQCMLLSLIAVIHEWKGALQDAKIALKKAQEFNVDSKRTYRLQQDISRVNKKIKTQKRAKKKLKKISSPLRTL